VVAPPVTTFDRIPDPLWPQPDDHQPLATSH